MAVFGNAQVQFKKVGVKVQIPESDIGKIMYYLNCVCTVVEYNDNDMRRYRNYSNWRAMSDEEDRLIFVLAAALSPDEFEGKVFFNAPNLCREASNEFYEIGQVRNLFVISQSILIGGQSRQVKQIMTYKPAWMQRNYFQPMANLAFRFSPAGQRQEALLRSAACTIS